MKSSAFLVNSLISSLNSYCIHNILKLQANRLIKSIRTKVLICSTVGKGFSTKESLFCKPRTIETTIQYTRPYNQGKNWLSALTRTSLTGTKGLGYKPVWVEGKNNERNSKVILRRKSNRASKAQELSGIVPKGFLSRINCALLLASKKTKKTWCTSSLNKLFHQWYSDTTQTHLLLQYNCLWVLLQTWLINTCFSNYS